MGWLRELFGSGRRSEARQAREAQVRELIANGNAGAAWRELIAAFADADHFELLRLAAEVLRIGGEASTAELFDRAADAPHDPQRFFELGSHLLSSEQPEAAALMLERALSFVPFDAVVRSELALAQARAGRPKDVVSTLALHPCLAEDAGALFSFGWASLLCGDLDAARGVHTELTVPLLRSKLGDAIERARFGMRDARDFFFVEYGGVVLDARGSLDGRYDVLRVEPDWVSARLTDAGWLIRELVPAPRRVIAIDAAHEPLAAALAKVCDGSVVPEPALGAILPLRSADRVDELPRGALESLIFTLTAGFERRIARAPDIIGAFARTVQLESDAFEELTPSEPDPALCSFVEARRNELAHAPARVAYVPDEPLAR